MPQALRLGVRLDQRDLLLGAAGQPQVVDGLLVDREDRGGRAELGAHVADRGAVGQRHRRDALAVELDELADHAVLAQHLGDGQHQVGGGRAGGSSPVSLKPTTRGISIDTGWPSMAASASMPPTPQPSTPRPLTIVVCESVPTQVSG